MQIRKHKTSLTETEFYEPDQADSGTVLLTMLALVAPRADAQNGSGSSSDESATAASSS